MKDSELMLQLRDVSFTYHSAEEPALRHLDLEVSRGEFVVVMGASGAGKTTLFQTFNGLVPRFISGEMQGNVELMGVDTREGKLGEHASRMGLVFQDFETQLFSTTVEQEVAFGPENLGVTPPELIKERIQHCLERVRLEGFEGRDPSTLSGGQKQRVAIAAVLAMNPEIMGMDEPTTDLDPVGKQEVLRIALELQADEKKTMLIAEHETEFALQADRVIVLAQGRIALEGAPDEVLEDPIKLVELGIRPLDSTVVAHELGVERKCLSSKDLLSLYESGIIERTPDSEERLRELDRERANHLGETIIEVSELTHTYPDGTQALNGLDLSVSEGEFLVILGPNGGGKTTFVKHLNGLLKPTSGKVLVDGQNTGGESVFDLSSLVGYVFQNPDHQIFCDTVAEEVAFGPGFQGVEGQELEERVASALEAVGLQGYEERDPFGLSKGERQRVAVASVLSGRPKVLILDEPTTGMDHRELIDMLDLIGSLNNQGHTVVAVTHSVWLATEQADRVIVVSEGQIALEGRPRKLFRNEDALQKRSIIVPQAVKIANSIGSSALTAEELTSGLRLSQHPGGI